MRQSNAYFLTGHFVRFKLKRPAIDRKRPENVRCPDVILFPVLVASPVQLVESTHDEPTYTHHLATWAFSPVVHVASDVAMHAVAKVEPGSTILMDHCDSLRQGFPLLQSLSCHMSQRFFIVRLCFITSLHILQCHIPSHSTLHHGVTTPAMVQCQCWLHTCTLSLHCRGSTTGHSETTHSATTHSRHVTARQPTARQLTARQFTASSTHSVVNSQCDNSQPIQE